VQAPHASLFHRINSVHYITANGSSGTHNTANLPSGTVFYLFRFEVWLTVASTQCRCG